MEWNEIELHGMELNYKWNTMNRRHSMEMEEWKNGIDGWNDGGFN